jgi:DNA polymerase-3 subunit delta'
MSGALWRPLPWQEALWLDLSALVLQKRLAHAMLMVGSAGVGKRWFARALIAFALCEKPSGYACGNCRSCTQLAVGSHPNAAVLSPDGHLGLAMTEDSVTDLSLVHWRPDDDRKRRDISIEGARSLIGKLTIASHYGSAKFALIDPADALNASSASALLKTIEEPPADTHLLLVSERPQTLIPTLRSRCQRVRFGLPDAELAQAWMAGQGVRDGDALQLASGAPLLALSLARGDGVGIRRQWAELWMAVAGARKDPLSAAAAIDKETLAEHLQWAQHWLTQQLRRVLSRSAGAAQREALAVMLQDVSEAQRRAAGNAHPQMLMESLFIRWLRLGRGVLGNAELR